MEHLKEKTLSSEPISRGRLLDVRRDEVELPDGTATVREYLRHPSAAVIVVVLNECVDSDAKMTGFVLENRAACIFWRGELDEFLER